MDTWYEILGVESDADKAAIKKSYFKAVRVHSPDKDPEQFKLIREAYETLMDDARRDRYDEQFRVDPEFRKAYCLVQSLKEQKDYEKAIACCNEVLHIKEEEAFLCQLGTLYELNDNAGKEIKVYTKLVNRYPEKKEYQVYLANAYQHRTWGKKASQVMDQLYREKYQSVSFYMRYGMILEENYDKAYACKIYREGIDYIRVHTDVEKYQKEYSEMCATLISWQMELNGGLSIRLDQGILEGYIEFLEKHLQNLYEFRDDVFLMLLVLQEGTGDLFTDAFKKFYEFAGMISEQGELEIEQKLALSQCKDYMEEELLIADEFILPEMKENAGSFYAFNKVLKAKKEFIPEENETFFMEMFPELEDENTDYEIALVDLKLTILDHWDVAKEQMSYTMEHYPVFAEILGDFPAEVVRGNGKNYLWNKYEKRYNKLNHAPSNATLIRANSEEQYYYDSEEEGTYRREEEKIGRNDPCPCGSGKKYKKCCGR